MMEKQKVAEGVITDENIRFKKTWMSKFCDIGNEE
jgi:hypothetical protein